MLAHLSREIHDGRVLAAFRRVPREEFVLPHERGWAYDDRPLPIGCNQTISQPAVVAITLQALMLRGEERVLDVGTGSGYQAALLAHLAAAVVSVERVPELAKQARIRLKALRLANVRVIIVERGIGWPPLAPYDAIAVGAAAPAIPDALFQQLADGGRMVIPVGARDVQDLLLVVRKGRERQVQTLGPCRFVPLIGAGGWPEAEA